MMKSTKGMKNLTGGKTSPLDLKRTVEGANEYSPGTDGDANMLNQIRAQYADPDMPIGSVPPPPSVKQSLAIFAKLLEGKDLSTLVDKLSERLSFECTGTRLYDAVLAKCQLAAELPGGVSYDELQHIRDEEHEHFLMLKQTIEELGGDPTAVSPAADASATATSGLCRVVTDPRTTMLQALEALLIAELTDNDGWKTLIDLCDALGLKAISKRFMKAADQEEEHLQNVREWISGGLLEDVSNVLPLKIKSATTQKAAKAAAARKKTPAKISSSSQRVAKKNLNTKNAGRKQNKPAASSARKVSQSSSRRSKTKTAKRSRTA